MLLHIIPRELHLQCFKMETDKLSMTDKQKEVSTTSQSFMRSVDILCIDMVDRRTTTRIAMSSETAVTTMTVPEEKRKMDKT